MKRYADHIRHAALCYLDAICTKVPELVEKENNGEGVHSEPDLSRQIVQGDLEAKEWWELALDSVMADFHTPRCSHQF